MYRRVMAFDFDGTLAEEEQVPPELERALEQCRASRHALFLVTGRRFETVALGRLGNLFTGVVWENGAVLAHGASGELYLPFGQLDAGLLKGLEEAGVPFEPGLAIAATWTPHDKTVWEVLGRLGGGATVEYNKGAVMLTPPGAAKGAGLERLLTLCGFSPRNLAAFGDAENDLSMLRLAEVAVAVGDAVPAVIELADVVAAQPGPAGVLEILTQYPLAGQFLDRPLRRERRIPLGRTEAGAEVGLPASRLAGRNLGVFGDSGTGKSWMVGLLAEGLHHEHYQVLLIDPEGDFRGLRALPRFVALGGEPDTMPAPAAVAALLDTGGVSAVVDLSSYPLALRGPYVADLLRAIRPLRERKFRPHWIVIEEAQQFLPLAGGSVAETVIPMLPEGGWTVVSYRPDRLAADVLRGLHHCVLTRLTEPEATASLSEYCPGGAAHEVNLAAIPTGCAWLSGGPLVRLRSAIRRVPHIRHLYKYLDVPLPPGKRFWFRDERGGVGKEAASLSEFLHLIPLLPIESLEYHDARQDFAAWAEGTLGDADLAARLRKLSNRGLKGQDLREALRQTLATHCAELEALR
ncbi:HAD hydrolase family protein [Nitrospira sp. Kam-Ns4a]